MLQARQLLKNSYPEAFVEDPKKVKNGLK